MSTRAIATSTLWQIFSQFTMAVLSTIAVKFVAIGLSRELAGAYNSAYGYLQLFAILADFGLYAVSVREVSTAKDPGRVLGALLVLRSIIAFLSLGAAVVIAWMVPAWQGNPLRIGIAIASFVPFFTLLAGVLRTIFQVRYKMHYVFIAEVAQRIVTVVLMAIIIFSGIRLSDDPAIYHYFLWVGSIGALVLLVLSIAFALREMRIELCFDRVLLMRLLKRAAPYGVAFLCIALYRQFDLTMIALLRDDFELQNASYGFASRISEMSYLIPTFLLNSTLPVLSERFDRKQPVNNLLGKTLFLILSIGSVAALFSFFWARPIMQLLTTEAYLSHGAQVGADTALMLLSIPIFLNGIVLFSFYALLTRHEWKALVVRMVIAVFISLGLNFYFIRTDGFVGAIHTSMIVHLFLALALFPEVLRVFPISFPMSYLVKWGGFSACLALGLWLTLPLLSTTPAIILGLAAACIFLALLAFLFRFHRIFFLPRGSAVDALDVGGMIE